MLVLPLLGLSTGTLGVTWFSFARAQLQQIASEGAMQLAEPDSDFEETQATIQEKIQQRLGSLAYVLTAKNQEGIATVNLELNSVPFLGPLNLIFPPLSVESDVPAEI